MRSRRGARRSVRPAASLGVLLCCAAIASTVRAVEPLEQFADGLRRRGMYDIALIYLERPAARGELPAELKAAIPIEIAATHLAAASATADARARSAHREQAAAALEAVPPRRPMLAARAAVLQADLAMAIADDARRSGDSAAGEQYLQAAAACEAAREALRVVHRDPTLSREAAADPAAQERLEEIRRLIVKVRIDGPTALVEAARLATNDAERKKLLEQALEQFASAAGDYRRLGAGQLALLRQGECYELLGDWSKALGSFGGLLAPSDASGAAQPIRVSAAVGYVRVALAAPEPLFAEAAEKGTMALAAVNFSRRPSDDELQLAVLSIRALIGFSERLPANSPKRRDARSEAVKLARLAAKFSSPYQQEALELLNSLGESPRQGAEGPPKNFAEAVADADLARSRWQSAVAALRSGEGDQATADDDRVEARDKALAAYEQALELSEGAASEDVDRVRYFLTYLYWDAERFAEAAASGEYVALQRSEYAYASRLAQIALAAFQRLSAGHEASEFDARRALELARYTQQRWPHSAAAEAAMTLLVNHAVKNNDVDAAVALLDDIPADTDARAAAEIQVGQALWKASREAGETAGAPAATSARKLIDAGVAHWRESGRAREPLLVSGETTLIEIMVSAGEAPKAVELLTTESGPLAWSQSPAAAESPELRQAVVQTAVLALFAVNPPQVAQATELLKSFQAESDTSAAALSAIASQLTVRWREARDAGDSATASALSAALAAVLDQAGAAGGSPAWTAALYFDLAEALTGGDPSRADSEAKSRYAAAAEQFGKLLNEGGFAPNLRDAYELRRIRCLRGAGKLNEAEAAVRRLLERHPNLLAAQIEAAHVLRQQGPSDPSKYQASIVGAAPDASGANAIWGWARIAAVTSRREDLREQHLEARYYAAAARLAAARAAESEAERQKLLETSQQEILLLARLSPELLQVGSWRGRFDGLLRQVQQALGEPVTGIRKGR